MPEGGSGGEQPHGGKLNGGEGGQGGSVGAHMNGGEGGTSGSDTGGSPHLGGDGGAGGSPFEPPDFEWCDGVMAPNRLLSDLCAEQTCPSLVVPTTGASYYEGLPAVCSSDPLAPSSAPSVMRRFESSCGSSVELNVQGGFLTWHFDEAQQLVGASLRLMDYFGEVCHSESYGQECLTSGAGVDLCKPASHCAAPLSEVPDASQTEVQCGSLCQDAAQGYRAPNDCGGVNLVRVDSGDEPDQRSNTTWSFDAAGELVGVMRRGTGVASNCDDGQLALGISWGTPCRKLDGTGYGSGDGICDVDYSGSATGQGGSGGSGGEGSGQPNGLISLEEAEQCAVECEPIELDEYCAGHLDCPQFDGTAYLGIGSYCDGGLFDSSCGGYGFSTRDAYGKADWYFDGDDQLVGGHLSEQRPRRLGTYCRSRALGTQCQATGETSDLCSAETGGCLEQLTGQEPATLNQLTVACPYKWQAPNDCGGVNVMKLAAVEHGHFMLWSFDADENLVGTRTDWNDGVVQCEDGSIAAGTRAGAPCETVGEPSWMCD